MYIAPFHGAALAGQIALAVAIAAAAFAEVAIALALLALARRKARNATRIVYDHPPQSPNASARRIKASVTDPCLEQATAQSPITHWGWWIRRATLPGTAWYDVRRC
eukprot:5692408-Alexandrium_andersonii.AAC.1